MHFAQMLRCRGWSRRRRGQWRFRLTLTTPSCSWARGRRRFALVHENPLTCRVARPLATASRLGFASGNPTPSARAHHATEMKCLRFGYGVVSRGRSRRWHCHTQSATDSIYRRPAPIGLVSLHFDFPFVRGDKSNRSHLCRMFVKYAL